MAFVTVYEANVLYTTPIAPCSLWSRMNTTVRAKSGHALRVLRPDVVQSWTK